MLLFSPIEQFDIMPTNYYLIYLNNNFTNLIFFFSFLFLSLYIFFKYVFIFKIIPNRFQLFVEYFINFVYDLLISITGTKGKVFLPFILTLFFFFFFS